MKKKSNQATKPSPQKTTKTTKNSQKDIKAETIAKNLQKKNEKPSTFPQKLNIKQTEEIDKKSEPEIKSTTSITSSITTKSEKPLKLEEEKKLEEKKLEEKKLEEKKLEEKKSEEKKLEEKKLEKTEEAVKPGTCEIIQSIYKEQFELVKNHISKSEIDERFCLSIAFKGNYKINLKDEKGAIIKESEEFSLENCKTYKLFVDEDMEAESKREGKPFTIAENKNSKIKENKAVENITKELKNMKIEEIQDKGEKFKQLIEARDLEDILYK